jgi:hypothetical protein
MTDHDDRELDAVLDTLARPDVPTDHVARVVARTSAATDEPPVDAPRFPAAYLKPRWLLPVAATLLVVLGATWQGERLVRDRFEAVTGIASGGSVSAPLPAWRTPLEIDRPVLPPQAYWGLDPFHELATLHTGAQELRSPGPRALRDSAPADGHPASARQSLADDEGTWVPASSGLAPIDIVSIAAAPLLVPPVAPLEEIVLAEIPLAPIVIAPLTNDEDSHSHGQFQSVGLRSL